MVSVTETAFGTPTPGSNCGKRGEIRGCTSGESRLLRAAVDVLARHIHTFTAMRPNTESADTPSLSATDTDAAPNTSSKAVSLLKTATIESIIFAAEIVVGDVLMPTPTAHPWAREGGQVRGSWQDVVILAYLTRMLRKHQPVILVLLGGAVVAEKQKASR